MSDWLLKEALDDVRAEHKLMQLQALKQSSEVEQPTPEQPTTVATPTPSSTDSSGKTGESSESDSSGDDSDDAPFECVFDVEAITAPEMAISSPKTSAQDLEASEERLLEQQGQEDKGTKTQEAAAAAAMTNKKQAEPASDSHSVSATGKAAGTTGTKDEQGQQTQLEGRKGDGREQLVEAEKKGVQDAVHLLTKDTIAGAAAVALTSWLVCDGGSGSKVKEGPKAAVSKHYTHDEEEADFRQATRIISFHPLTLGPEEKERSGQHDPYNTKEATLMHPGQLTDKYGQLKADATPGAAAATKKSPQPPQPQPQPQLTSHPKNDSNAAANNDAAAVTPTPAASSVTATSPTEPAAAAYAKNVASAWNSYWFS
jgi:hypothetical protein